ncbi:MAG: hypothetical protein S4CHLAM20_00650 [Chlamydiia bacterium]|nr:hypothetical protein [Chlamydiia bacterium]
MKDSANESDDFNEFVDKLDDDDSCLNDSLSSSDSAYGKKSRGKLRTFFDRLYNYAMKIIRLFYGQR